MLTKETLMQDTRKTEKKEIKSLKDHVFIKELSGGDLFTVQQYMEEDMGRGTRFLVKQSLVDDKGVKLFGKKEEIKAFFDNKPAIVITEIIQACTEVSKLDADVETIKEEAKN